MRLTRVLLAVSVLTITACSTPAADEPPGDPRTVRVATYNASMNRPAAGDLVANCTDRLVDPCDFLRSLRDGNASFEALRSVGAARHDGLGGDD